MQNTVLKFSRCEIYRYVAALQTICFLHSGKIDSDGSFLLQSSSAPEYSVVGAI
jgi:hypothetical protein